jgi:hypothetical protein
MNAIAIRIFDYQSDTGSFDTYQLTLTPKMQLFLYNIPIKRGFEDREAREQVFIIGMGQVKGFLRGYLA